jgi:hypothetical protein
MPHVDLKFKADVVSGDLLYSGADQIIQIVAKYFNLQPQQITLEVIPQSHWTKNRKDVDLELSLNHDPEGKRLSVAKDLAKELTNWLKEFLIQEHIHCEISVWIQLFSSGVFITA